MDVVDPFARYRLKRVVNAAGTMTSIGSSVVTPDAIAASAALQPHFVSMSELQARASEAIASSTGAEAGYVTACSASGITLAIAATMTGPDLASIERLPNTSGLKNEIVIQACHCVNYGAPIEQAVRLAGAQVVVAGSATGVRPHQMEAEITPATAAILHVVSHHVDASGQLSLDDVISIATARQLPVIVDMASEYDLRGPIAQGAALVIYSAHKFLGGPTAGIVAGRRELVLSCFLQNYGIGRTMKVGKEGIVGTIAALEAWEHRDQSAIRARETEILLHWESALSGLDGIRVERHQDWTGNPIERVKLTVAASSGLYAWELADRLAARDPAVYVRDDLAEQGTVYLDPCNLKPGEEIIVSRALREVIDQARISRNGRRTTFSERQREAIRTLLAWPGR